ncbi:probable methyltransferase-like protein 24 [Haliotis rufescens]|uniref:probable methyltransferase-like protein 24 n=1 Tax=Haliotis rufescens TaxID=6454 RepID=UPI00201F4AE6|nr:probable methyltransferase-like protein 24 [Haliotis rufescens]
MAFGIKAVAAAFVGVLIFLVFVLYSTREQTGYTGDKGPSGFSNAGFQAPPSLPVKTLTNYKDPLKITEWWQASSLLKWDWEKPPEYKCTPIVRKGNWHVCMDGNYAVKPPCLVYSFGIWDDWSFDDAMGALGCEVHSFDPSIGLKDFNRSKNVHFHDIGLSGTDSDSYVATKDIYVKNKQIWKIRRLESIMKMLGHTNRHIDVLKIDVETSEWPTAKDLAESGVLSKVRQFAVEWHLFPAYPSKDKYVEFYTSVQGMKDKGLRTFRADFHNRKYGEESWTLQADVNYVNILFKGN